MPRISVRVGRGSRVSMSYSAWVLLGLLALPLIMLAVVVRGAVWCVAWLIDRASSWSMSRNA